MRAEIIYIKEAPAPNALRVLGQTADVQRRVSDGELRLPRAGSAACACCQPPLRDRAGTVPALLLLLLGRTEGAQARTASSIRLAISAGTGTQATLKLLSES